MLPGLVPPAPATTAVLLVAAHRGGLCSDQREIWSLFLPRAQSGLNRLWASCPRVTRCPQRSPEPPAVGADGADSQSGERGKPELLLGATTNVALGKHLSEAGWVAPPALQGVPAKGPAVSSVQKTGLFSEGCRRGQGLGGPSLCRGTLGTWESPLLGPDPRGWWWSWLEREREMEPCAGGAHSPKK